MPRLDEIRDDLIQALRDQYGQPPAPDPSQPSPPANLFERLASVALRLGATAKVAQAAFTALQDAAMLEPATLAAANPLEIDDILKQARVAMAIRSIRPLQKLARWFADHDQALDDDRVGQLSTEAIRTEWRALNGVGLASTDALLLYGLHRVSYPLDRATYRILVRHGWLDSTADYDEARTLVERFAQIRDLGGEQKRGGELDEFATAELLTRLSEWFGRIGRDHCKPTQTRCESCPLQPWLPESGPVEAE